MAKRSAYQTGRANAASTDTRSMLGSSEGGRSKGRSHQRHVEDDHARWLTQWRCANEKRIPELRHFYHWPQGGKRNIVTASILKAMGVRKGPWDFWLFARRGNCPGLMIELKHGNNTLTDEQKELGDYMVSQGWKVAVCYHWHDAATELCRYLGVERGF